MLQLLWLIMLIRSLSMYAWKPVRFLRNDHIRCFHRQFGHDVRLLKKVQSKSSTVIKSTRKLYDNTVRKVERKVIVEGPKVISDLANQKILPKFVIVHERVFENDRLDMTLNRIGPDNIFLASSDILDYICDTSTNQGIIGVYDEPKMPSLTSFETKNSLGLILDGIQDPTNIGTLIRSSVGFEVDFIISVNSCDVFSSKAVRCSAGGCFQIPIYQYSTFEFMKESWTKKFQLLVADVDQSCLSYKNISYHKPTLITCGSEAHGPSPFILQYPGAIPIRIPTNPLLESLNVGVAGSIILAESFAARST